jgi:hypothetical protein
MTKFKERMEAARREMAVGRGGRLWPRPVPLEPPFTPFDPLRPGDGYNQPPKGWPVPDVPTELRFLRINPSSEDQYTLPLAEQFLLSLNSSFPVSWEVLGLDGGAYLQVAAASEDLNAIASQVKAHYPGCEAFMDDDLLKDEAVKLRHARGYRLCRSHLFLIREGHRTEPYAALIGLLDALEPGESALFQVLIIPARRDWQGNILKVARNPFDASKPAFHHMPQLPKRAEAKVAKPIFAVAMRLAASNIPLITRLEGSFLSQFQSEENGLKSMEAPYPIEAVLRRTTYSSGMLLNLGELAALVHLPDPDSVPESLATAEPGAAAPALARHRILAPLGVNRHRGVEAKVGVSAEQLSRHLAIFGGTGYGKTNLMKCAFAPLIEQGCGMAIIDPKGDLARGFLDLVPEHRLDDVVWFDPTDREHPPALNVLQASDSLEHETLTAELMVGLKRLFQGNAEFGPRMEWILRNAIRTLLASQSEKTLYDIPRFLEDTAYREAVLSTVQDRELREFWGRRNLSQSVVDPVLNRLSSFLDRPTIRNIVGQPNKIDFHRILRENKVFIANLEKGVLQEAAYILGSFILSRLQLAALARRAGERTLFPILVDEFHNFAGPGMDTASIETFLSEARSYNAPLVVATQYVGHLNREVVTALFGNVGTLVCLHLGQIDAQLLQRELGDFTSEDLLDLGIGEAIVRMGSAREAFNIEVPLKSDQESYREPIIARSRERYCQPRAQVEAFLSRSPESKSQDRTPPKKEVQGQQAAANALLKNLTADQWHMLEYLAEHPDESVTAVYQALGFSGRRGARVREQLKIQGLAVEVETRLGQGNRPALFLVPTPTGLKAVNKPSRSGRGGALHCHFQSVVANRARGLGYEAHTEHRLQSGGSVDVHLSRENISLAVEIAVQSRPHRELKNIRKCLEAGYDRVLALFLDSELLQETQSIFASETSLEDRQRVAFLELARLGEELK